MILYHGSNVEIFDIDLSMSKPYKDFGRAFYLSADKKQAEALAEATVARTGKGVCTISSFSFDESLMEASTLNVKTFNGYSEEWAEFIYKNRDENQKFDHDYDIVYGPIADDYIGLQIREFRRHMISFDEFITRIRYHKGETYQYAFCTSMSISKLIRI